MAFNSNTYRANKAAKLAEEAWKEANALSARIREGEAYDWEANITLPGLIRSIFHNMARNAFYLSLNERPKS